MKIVEHSLPYKRELDGLRGVAILLVLLYHVWPQVFPFGYVGVDVFFVLSGYLITKVIVTRSESGVFRYSEFYRNRIRRIFPAMILVLAATFAVGYLFLFADELAQLGKHIKSSAFFYQNFRLMREAGYWDEAAQLKPFLHFWSLSIEEQFYAFWPLLVTLLPVKANRYILGLLLAGLAAAALLNTGVPDPFFHSLSRFWELALGGVVVWLEGVDRLGRVLARASIPIWLAFAGALALVWNAGAFSPVVVLPVVLVTAVWLVRLHRGADALLGNRPMVFLGLISYPLYLWHYPIVSYFHIFGIAIAGHEMFIIAGAIALSYLTYRYVEIYCRRQTRPVFILVLAVLAASLGFGGMYAAASSGMPQRPHLLKLKEMEPHLVRESALDENCSQLTGPLLEAERAFPYCISTTSDPSQSFIAVIGDSHAHVVFPGIAEAAKEHGSQAILLANSGCPPFIGGAMGKMPADVEKCQTRINQIYSVLDGLPNLKSILLVARGPKYMTGRGFGPVDEPDKAAWRYREYFQPDNSSYDQAEVYIRALGNSLKYFSKKQWPVKILLENPELGFSPKACSERPFGILPTHCTLPYEKYAERMRDHRGRVMALAKSIPGVEILDPEPLFCDGKVCTAVKGGRMLYADDDHLSVDGSRYLAEGLIGQIVPRP